ncbi:unnamed protein product [Prorocentrum cordatum]|uniref:C3H1-type domain-containing protein n=1 Tax=Prorocentrum cordatum TaxID=2364126 RepID=A0ABN9Q4G3_9DINO|nr:unnamed protein product [Polarella glacialis]
MALEPQDPRTLGGLGGLGGPGSAAARCPAWAGASPPGPRVGAAGTAASMGGDAAVVSYCGSSASVDSLSDYVSVNSDSLSDTRGSQPVQWQQPAQEPVRRFLCSDSESQCSDSWAEGSSDSSQNRSIGCGLGSGRQYSRFGSSGSSARMPGSAAPEGHAAGRAEEHEGVGQEGAERRKDNEAAHAAGTCKPCLYHNMKAGCANGHACSFCHLPHATQRRSRPSKAERLRCRQLVARLDRTGEGDAAAACELADEGSLRTSPYMLSILRAMDRQQGPRQAGPCVPAQAVAEEEPRQRPGCG